MLRFTIRDVLWLMVVVAVALGWWMDHRGSSAEIQRQGEYIMRDMKWTMRGDKGDGVRGINEASPDSQ